jgi:hypothetical protein
MNGENVLSLYFEATKAVGLNCLNVRETTFSYMRKQNF